MDYEWDLGKARRNFEKHGVDFADAALALDDAMALTIRDPDSDSEERFITLGRVPFGRLLAVALTWRGERIRIISARQAGYQARAPELRGAVMREEYDFEEGRRGPVGQKPPGKTRITIRLDSDLIAWFKTQVDLAGGGSYQRLINTALREHIARADEPLEETLRRVLREELQQVV